MTSTASAPLLDVTNLQKHFTVGNGVVKAVDDVTFSISKGETFGLVGESGCGKTTTGRAILRLIEPTAGQVTFDGADILALSPSALRAQRRQMQIVFQDPYASLNPRMTIGEAIAEPLVIHGIGSAASRRDRVAELLGVVGLDGDYIRRYPHEFSGGQRQRIGIARALATSPDFLVADEPVSALDVSIQAQVLALIESLQARLGLAMLLVAHDLAVVQYLARRVAIMYMGRIVEIGATDDVYHRPRHPYTRALLSAVPVARGGPKRTRTVLKGDPPSPLDPPSGCRFRTRCPHALAACAEATPTLRAAIGAHAVACLRDDI